MSGARNVMENGVFKTSGKQVRRLFLKELFHLSLRVYCLSPSRNIAILSGRHAPPPLPSFHPHPPPLPLGRSRSLRPIHLRRRPTRSGAGPRTSKGALPQLLRSPPQPTEPPSPPTITTTAGAAATPPLPSWTSPTVPWSPRTADRSPSRRTSFHLRYGIARATVVTWYISRYLWFFSFQALIQARLHHADKIPPFSPIATTAQQQPSQPAVIASSSSSSSTAVTSSAGPVTSTVSYLSPAATPPTTVNTPPPTPPPTAAAAAAAVSYDASVPPPVSPIVAVASPGEGGPAAPGGGGSRNFGGGGGRQQHRGGKGVSSGSQRCITTVLTNDT